MVGRQSSSSWTSGTLNEAQFVGRESERAALMELLDSARQGCGAVALIEGQPGIGKTRLAREIARAASLQGADVIEAACTPAWSGLPLAPLLRARGPVPSRVLRLVGEGGDRLQQGYARQEEIAAGLCEAAVNSPSVTLLDDLQWADRETIGVLVSLAHVAQSASLLVIGTYRGLDLGPEHPLSPAIAELHRKHLLLRLHLDVFGESEVDRLVLTLVPDIDEATRMSIRTRSNGVPYFVEELGRSIANQAGHSPSREGSLPEGVSELISSRLSRVSRECRQVLEAAATAGQEIDLELLCAMLSPVKPSSVLDLLDEGLAAGLLIEEPVSTPHSLRFRHDLVREYLYHGLTPGRRATLHRSAADAIGSMADGGERELQRSHHLLQSGPLASPAEIARSCCEAGEAALRAFAFATAAEHFQRAVSAFAGGDMELLSRISRGCGRAHFERGELDLALSSYERAIAALNGDGFEEIRAAIRLEAGEALARLGRVREALPYLDHALSEAISPALALSIRTERARCLIWIGAISEAEAALNGAIEASDVLALPNLQARTRQVRADLHSATGDLRSAAADYAAAAQFSLDDGDVRAAARNLLLAASFNLQLGREQEGHTLAARAAATADRCHDLPTQVEAHAIRAIAFVTGGRWQQAFAEVEAGNAAGRALRSKPLLALHLATATWQMRTWRARDTDIEALLGAIREDALPSPFHEPLRSLFLARVLARAGRREEARSALDTITALLPKRRPKANADAWLMGSFYLVATLCDLGDTRELAAWYPVLSSHGDVFVPYALPALELGRVAAATERWDEAFAWFEAATRLASTTHARPLAALTAYETGLAYTRRAADGDASQATRLLTIAAEAFAPLDMPWYEQRTLRLLQEAAGTFRVGNLSPRETEILQLIAAGLTNRAIATRLVLSEHTIVRHVANIFAKLGVENRAGATARAAQFGLKPE